MSSMEGSSKSPQKEGELMYESSKTEEPPKSFDKEEQIMVEQNVEELSSEYMIQECRMNNDVQADEQAAKRQKLECHSLQPMNRKDFETQNISPDLNPQSSKPEEKTEFDLQSLENQNECVIENLENVSNDNTSIEISPSSSIFSSKPEEIKDDCTGNEISAISSLLSSEPKVSTPHSEHLEKERQMENIENVVTDDSRVPSNSNSFFTKPEESTLLNSQHVENQKESVVENLANIKNYNSEISSSSSPFFSKSEERTEFNSQHNSKISANSSQFLSKSEECTALPCQHLEKGKECLEENLETSKTDVSKFSPNSSNFSSTPEQVTAFHSQHLEKEKVCVPEILGNCKNGNSNKPQGNGQGSFSNSHCKEQTGSTVAQTGSTVAQKVTDNRSQGKEKQQQQQQQSKKNKGGHVGENYERINYLVQLSHSLVNMGEYNSELGSMNFDQTLASQTGSLATAVGKRCLIRLTPSLKRMLCKGCGTALIYGVNARVRHRTNRQKHLVVTCLTCNTMKRFVMNPKYKLWCDQEESLV